MQVFSNRIFSESSLPLIIFNTFSEIGAFIIHSENFFQHQRDADESEQLSKLKSDKIYR